jgi:hypothetical protein
MATAVTTGAVSTATGPVNRSKRDMGQKRKNVTELGHPIVRIGKKKRA